jgi:hypothetical protein
MKWLKAVLLGSVLSLASPGHADVVFTDFGAGNTYNHILAWATNNNNIGFQEVAMPFTPTENAQLTNAIVAFGYGVQGSAAIFNLYSNASGTPGTLLASSSVITPSQPFNSATSDLTAVDFSSANIQLVAGTTYWLDADPTFGGSTSWNETTSGSGTFVYRTSPTAGWSSSAGTLGAFNINGVVPEPGSVLLFAASGLALLVRRRARGWTD